jgi:tRNA pseudouridine55 synthase
VAVFIVDKPLGWTSFDVVAKARKLLGTKRIGHTGTLDPLATGVLVLLTNESTKLVPYLEIADKDYLGFVSLGATTPTLDGEGPISQTKPVPPFGPLEIEAILRTFRGQQMQLPPDYSAIHINGQRAYDLARAGKEVKLEPRAVNILELNYLGNVPNMQAFKRELFPEPLGNYFTLKLEISVSSGTYIRSLARDLGIAFGTVAHLSGLIRTRVGKFRLHQAIPLEQLNPSLGQPDLSALEYPIIELNPKEARDLKDGKRIASTQTGRYTITLENQLIAIAQADGSSLKALRVWQ